MWLFSNYFGKCPEINLFAVDTRKIVWWMILYNFAIDILFSADLTFFIINYFTYFLTYVLAQGKEPTDIKTFIVITSCLHKTV